MTQEFSLKDAERKVFRATLQDGLLDILIGCIVLQFAVAPLLSTSLGDFWSSAVFLPFWAVVFSIVWLVRKSIVTPRLGSVKFGPARKRRLTKATAMMLVINIISVILGTLLAMYSDMSSGLLYVALLGIIVLMLASLAAYFLECLRLFIYGSLFVFSLASGEWLFANFGVPHHGFPVTFGFTTFIILLTGVILFLRLLRQHPLPLPEKNMKNV